MKTKPQQILIITGVIILSIIAGVVIAHAAPLFQEVQPTYTPNPTYTAWATYTALPTYTLCANTPTPTQTNTPTPLPTSTPYPTQTAYPTQTPYADQHCVIVEPTPTSTMTQTPTPTMDVIVSNSDELNNIDWQDGLTVWIQPGTYEATLNIGADNVTVYAAGVELFGGREQLLAPCGYSQTGSADRAYGVLVQYVKDIVIHGPMDIHGYGTSGLRFTNAERVQLDSLSIYNNGPNDPGIKVYGYAFDITMTDMDIYDNGSDAIQTGGGAVRNWIIEDSLLHNDRMHPDYPDQSFNYCTHSDGMQVYGGGENNGPIVFSGVEIYGMTNGIILGQTTDSNGNYAEVHDVTLEDMYFHFNADNAILSYPNIYNTGWVLDNVYVDCAGTHTCLYYESGDLVVRNSYFENGNIYLPRGLAVDENNCRWNMSGYSLGEVCQR